MTELDIFAFDEDRLTVPEVKCHALHRHDPSVLLLIVCLTF